MVRFAGLPAGPPLPIPETLAVCRAATDPEAVAANGLLNAATTVARVYPYGRETAMVAHLHAIAQATIRPPEPIPGRADLVIGGLFAGGAERQICNLAIGLADAGWRPRVVCIEAVPVQASHYLDLLAERGIPVALPESTTADQAADLPPALDALLDLFDPQFRPRTATVFAAMAEAPPTLTVCYLDWPNVVGGLVATLLGVPHVLLSGRNVAPDHFPHFFAAFVEDFKVTYSVLADHPAVRLSCNAAAGAADYARWLELDPARIAHIPNAVDAATAAMTPVDPGSAPPRVLGLFRLAPEKRPEIFLEIIARLVRRRPEVRAVICGTGLLADTIAARIRTLGLEGIVTLAGVVENVRAMMDGSALLLHVSAQEGIPNAVLEAQALGLPVVATAVGGTPETMATALRPFLHAPDDVDGLERSCLALLDDPVLRRTLGTAARAEIRARFSLEALVNRTLAAAGLPRSLINPDPSIHSA